MKHRMAILAGVGIVLAAGGIARAAVIVDLDAADGPTQSGYTSWNPSHSDGGALNQSNAFADAALSTDGTVDVTMTTAGSTYERNYAPVTGPLASQTNLLQDLVFFNNRLSGNNYYQVQLDDLKAGSYRFTAYHVATNALSGDATVDVLLNGSDTGMDVTLLNTSAPAQIRSSIVDFTVASDNDPITIRYANPTENHFGLNGFELDAVAPAPPSVKVDINGLGGPTAAGWTSWDPANPNNSALDTGVGTFPISFATDGTVDVRITTAGSTYERNYGVDHVTGTFSADTSAELWQDQYFFNNTAGAPLTITLDDLEAGDYALTLYSYLDDANTSGHSGDGTAIADVFINGVDSGVDAVAYGGNDTAYAASFLESMATVIDFNVAADDQTITLQFRNPTANHFGLNGFELRSTAVIPEPSTLVLSVLGLLGLVGCGRRRRRV